MRVIRNIGYVKKRKRTAKLTATLGFVTLASALVLGFMPSLFAFAYLLLFGGFVLFNVGMQQVGKWNRGPKYRNDSLIDQKLAPFSDKFALIHFPQIGEKVIEHLLVHPAGVVVITARELPGEVIVRGNRWRRGGNPLRRVFGISGPQLGQPGHETKQNIRRLETYLKEHQLEVDVTGVVLFVNQRVILDAEDPDVEALVLDELPDYVRDLTLEEPLSQSEQRALIELLSLGEELETSQRTRTRRPVRKRAA